MITSEETDAYAALGLPPSASTRDVRARFRRLAKKFHPDLNAGSAWHEEQFRRIRTAYETIYAVRRAEASAAPLAETACDVSNSTSSAPGAPKAVWVSVGTAARPAGTPLVAETALPGRRRVTGWRGRRAGAITWSLAALACFMVVIVIVGPHGVNEGSAATDTFSEAPMTGAVPDRQSPSGDLLASDVASSDPAPVSAGAVSGVRAPAVHDDFGSPAPAAESGSAAPAEFSVDAKYTRIDPAFTAVDHRYTTVDVPVSGVGSLQIGVDPANTGIDPKLIQP